MKIFDKYVPGHRTFNRGLLWDYDTTNFDPKDWKKLIAQRTIEMGKLEDFFCAFDLFGGIEGFALIAKNEVTGLNERNFDFMCRAFNLKKEETECYKRIQSRKKLLNS